MHGWSIFPSWIITLKKDIVLCLAKNNFLSLFFLSQELPPSLLRSSSSKSSSQQEREKEERRHYRICHRNLDRVVIRARLHYRRSPFFLKGIKLRNSLCLREGEPYLPAAFTSAGGHYCKDDRHFENCWRLGRTKKRCLRTRFYIGCNTFL